MHLADRRQTNVYNAAASQVNENASFKDQKEKEKNNNAAGREKKPSKTVRKNHRPDSAFIKVTSSVFEDDSGASTRLTTTQQWRMKKNEVLRVEVVDFSSRNRYGLLSPVISC